MMLISQLLGPCSIRSSAVPTNYQGNYYPHQRKEAKAFKEVLGEAYFMRGLSYFYLTRLYGDVPLLLETMRQPSPCREHQLPKYTIKRLFPV